MSLFSRQSRTDNGAELRVFGNDEVYVKHIVKRVEYLFALGNFCEVENYNQVVELIIATEYYLP